MESCELTHVDREPIDMARVAQQHGRYVELLRELGCQVVELAAQPGLPDGVFVEDPAIVLDELAVITRPGAPSRRPETASIMEALRPYRPLFEIASPGTLDGGDVIVSGQTIYVGLSSRSNQAGIDQLAEIVGPHGYEVRGVELTGCLHLKSAACAIGNDRLLVQREWIDPAQFEAKRIVETDPAEIGAANVVWLGDDLIYPSEFPVTAERLRQQGFRVHCLEYDELAKAEGAVTCCSLLIRGQGKS